MELSDTPLSFKYKTIPPIDHCLYNCNLTICNKRDTTYRAATFLLYLPFERQTYKQIVEVADVL
jgi:hypothetical protein